MPVQILTPVVTGNCPVQPHEIFHHEPIWQEKEEHDLREGEESGGNEACDGLSHDDFFTSANAFGVGFLDCAIRSYY